MQPCQCPCKGIAFPAASSWFFWRWVHPGVGCDSNYFSCPIFRSALMSWQSTSVLKSLFCRLCHCCIRMFSCHSCGAGTWWAVVIAVVVSNTIAQAGVCISLGCLFSGKRSSIVSWVQGLFCKLLWFYVMQTLRWLQPFLCENYNVMHTQTI